MLHTDKPTRGATVTVLHGGEPAAMDLNAMKIARFMGADIARARWSDALPAGGCLIASAQTLSELCGGAPDQLRRISSMASNVFVYGFEPSERHGLLLEKFTQGRICGVARLPETSCCAFSVDEHSRDVTGQFTGLSFGKPNPAIDFAFIAGGGNCSSLVRAGQWPLLFSFTEEGCHWMMSACREIADLDMAVSSGTSILTFFSRLAPLMIFLKAALGDRVWHNDSPSACFIIDDPLLQPRYGFLDYQRFLQVLERERFSATLAFIPWNFRRSDQVIAELFAARPQQLSVCIHGCDHTAGEFGVSDYPLLCNKARLAMDRMVEHQRLTGVPFDPVMVFPQGIFSTPAPWALKTCGYLAAVNSTPYPIDEPGGLRLQDLLEIASQRYADFPIFSRRHPEAMAELAFDLFVGKPALLVEHHGYFREGYEALAEAIQRVNGLDERLRWSNLTAVCSDAHRKRVGANGEVQVQFVTEGVGKDAVAYSAEREAGQQALYKAKVFVRRRLCEFRDNYVERSAFLSRSVQKARELLSARNGAQE